MIRKIINEEKPVINITGLNLDKEGKPIFCFGFITSFVKNYKDKKRRVVTERIVEVAFPIEGTEQLSMIRATFISGQMNQPKVENFITKKNDVLNKIKTRFTPLELEDGQSYLESFCFDSGITEALDWYITEFTKSKGIL